MRPAVVRVSAYAQVVNANAVGTTARYTLHAIAPVEASPISPASCGTNGRQTTRPTTHAENVIDSDERS